MANRVDGKKGIRIRIMAEWQNGRVKQTFLNFCRIYRRFFVSVATDAKSQA